MKFLLTFSILITVLMTSSWSQEPQSTQGGGVWLVIENRAEVPVKDPKGGFKSTNTKLHEIVKKFKVSEVSYPLSNAKNPELKKVIELRCKDCDARVVKKELEVKGFASQKRPIELAPEYKQLLTPNDLTLTFTSGDWALNLIGAQCAWDVTTGNPNVIIGISDQNYYADPNNGGVHEELAGKVTYYDTTNIATRTHGTAVAIIAAGNTNNNIGKSSIGFNSRLALYRMTYNDMLAAAAAGIKVINMSWTSGCSYNSYAQQAVTDAYNMGAFLVAAAGNGTTCGGPANLVYPAANDNVFAVTSIGPNNNHERTPGNPATTHQHYTQVDLSAPGYDVPISSAPSSYLTNSGTSFAAPFVSGTVALMLAANPNLTQAEIEQILESTAVNIDDVNPNYAGLIGAGRLNACAAVTAAQAASDMTATISVNSNECSQDKIIADLEVTGGVEPYTYAWSNGATSEDLNGAAPGSYTVTVTDDNGQTANASITVPAITPISITQFYNLPVNGNDGSIDISVSPAGSYTYAWSTGATTEDISGLAPGNYSVTVMNANGCREVKNFVVPSSLSITARTGVGCTKGSGFIDLIVNGGVAPFTYSWSNGSTVQDPSNLAAGTYSVTVTDATGVTATGSLTVPAYANMNISGVVTHSSIAQGNGAINLTVSGQVPQSFFWSRSSGGFTASTEDISGLTPATYYVNVVSMNGCKSEKSFQVLKKISKPVRETSVKE